MKVLVSNHHLSDFGGSETFTYTIATVIKQLGHDIDVYIYTRVHNATFLNKLKEHGILVYQINPPQHNYDIILANHNTTINQLLKYHNKDIIVQTCHGIIPVQEQPHPNILHFASVSHEIRNHLERMNIKSVVIPNAVDCRRFACITNIADKPKTVLSLVQDNRALNNIKEVCKDLSLELIFFSKFSEKKTFDIEYEINKSDIVISVGRGVFEGMSCGRNIICYDSRSYYTNRGMGHGLLTSVEKIEEGLKDNFTGRNSNKYIDNEQLKQEILQYNASYGKMGQMYIKKNFNMIDSIQQYFQMLQ